MDNSVSEGAPLPSPAEEEMPGMVPVSIRTTLPEFQHCSLENVLAGILLTWEEFLQLFDIRPSPNEYFIKGQDGVKHDLGEKIVDYVDKFKKKQKIYPVTLERVDGTNWDRSEKASSKSENSNESSSNYIIPPSAPAGEERDGNPKASGYPRKRQLIDTDKRKKNKKATKLELEEIAQSVVQSVAGTSTAIPAKRANPGGRKPRAKRNSKSGSSASPEDPSLINIDEISQPGSSNPVTARTSSSAKAKLKRLGSTEKRQLRDKTPTTTGAVRKGRKPKVKPQLVEETRRSSRTSKNTKESDSTDDISDSEDEEVPSKDKKKLLKEEVIQYLTNKVSPRSFMRLRNELMALRDQEKYFKVTSVVPMTAGMMEQMFCRKINH